MEQTGYIENLTQEERVLEILRNAKNNSDLFNQSQWVNGMSFLRLERPITQFHARIWGLQKKGFQIEGRFIEGKNYKEYRLISEPEQIT